MLLKITLPSIGILSLCLTFITMKGIPLYVKDRDDVLMKGPYTIYNMVMFSRHWKPNFTLKANLLCPASVGKIPSFTTAYVGRMESRKES